MIYEVCIAWDGEFFAHEALTLQDAREWAAQYPSGQGCRVRIWEVIR